MLFRSRNGSLADLQPDAKSQVTVEYVDGKPVGCTKVVVSTQHNEKSRNGKKYSPGLIEDMISTAVESALPKGWMPQKPSDFLVNPTGNFVVGGPDGDCGLTGRKIIVDTYGGRGAHGGGAFSGKDPSKVDRSAAYACRHIAKNLVAAGVASEVLVQVSYAIGVAKPMGIYVNTFGTSKVNMPDGKIAQVVEKIFDMRPYAIETRLKLRSPIYSETAAYGHMGRKNEVVTKAFKGADGKEKKVKVELFTWEKLDMVKEIKKAFNLK